MMVGLPLVGKRQAPHDALITSSNIPVVLANMHATSNVRALLVDEHLNFASLVVQAFMLDKSSTKLSRPICATTP